MLTISSSKGFQHVCVSQLQGHGAGCEHSIEGITRLTEKHHSSFTNVSLL